MTAFNVAEVTETKLRSVMGHFPTGVVVVSANTREGRSALTLQSFQSLSLDPALCLISVARTSTSWPAIRESGSFAVTILARAQNDLARQFARSNGNKFQNVDVIDSPLHGHPIISGGSAWVECEIVKELDGGDHHIVVARVIDLELMENAADPVLFHASRFAELNPVNR